MRKKKNCEELINVISAFRNENIALLIVGDGPCRRELERQTAELGLEKQVIFTGMVQPDTVSRYYHAGDLFVSASTSETQGLTYMEAMSAGLPMLCRADDCLDGVLINGANGWQYRTQAELRRLLEKFMKTPGLSAAMRRKAWETGERFSIPAFSEAVESVYYDRIKNFSAQPTYRAEHSLCEY